MTPRFLRSHSSWITALALAVLAFAAQPNLALAQGSRNSGRAAHGSSGYGGGAHASASHYAGTGRYGGTASYGGSGRYGNTVRYGGPGRYGSADRYRTPGTGGPRGARPGTVQAGSGRYQGRAYGTGYARAYSSGYGRRYVGGYVSHWRGGNWYGRYWPPVIVGASFLWFLPVIPAYSPVYWWGQVPYYYYNDAYYTWSPDDDGYVATAPPPAAADDDGYADNAGNEPAPSGEMAPDDSAAEGTAPSARLYAYPKNGQTRQQQAQDRQACEAWARSADGTGGNSVDDSGNAEGPESSTLDYRRALAACLTGRGYSVD